MSELSTSSESAPTDGRIRNRLVRRERVYVAAIELFVGRGFDGTTMDDIAERAAVSRSTVFNHFQRKTLFIDEWTSRRRQRARAAVGGNLEGRPLRSVLGDYLLELAKDSQTYRAETAVIFGTGIRSTDASGNTYLASELTSFVDAAARGGQLRAGVETRTVGLLIAGAYFATLERWIVDPPPFDLSLTLLAILDMVIQGISGSGRQSPPTTVSD